MSYLKTEVWIRSRGEIQRIWSQYGKPSILSDETIIVAWLEGAIAGVALVPSRENTTMPNRIQETGVPGSAEVLLKACVQYRKSRGEDCAHKGQLH